MRELYPDIEPYHSELISRESLPDGRCHQLYLEQCGNPDGIPVLFLHGGPGSGCRPSHRCYFDPERYHIVLFDQRGCGRSLPAGELEHNTTQFLLDDIEVIRKQLNINRWVIFGGSWGATLGLVYAQHHAGRVIAMILRGVFLGRQQDIDWVYAAGGASKLFPDAWQRLVAPLAEKDQQQPIKAYHYQLTHANEAQQRQAALALGQWESTIVTLRDYELLPDPEKELAPLAHAKIQLHFALNGCFIKTRPILDHLDAIRHLPTHIIQGRYDIVCPVQQSWELKQKWPEAELNILPLAGHAGGEPVLIDALVTSTEQLADKLS